ncbi:hypothetical protein ACFYO2_38135 [Streptomyces sp. NPDC006602]|uniref:hypothetical protein n=1 Tax=Streptomyces sp. NPDC006602 TaxID=3364751 RepID=UPI003690ED6E
MLAMAVLLFGVVFTHGLHVENVKGHLVTSAAAPAQVLSEGAFDATDPQVLSQRAAIGERHGGHDPAHHGEYCLSGQPQQGPVLTPPCFAASVSESTAVGPASVKRGQGEPVQSAASSAALRLSVVQQV